MGLKPLQGLQGLAAMGGAIEEVVEDVADDASAVDHVGDATRQQAEGFRHSEGLAQLLTLIHQQRVGQAVALREASMAGGVITTHPPDLGPQGFEIGLAVPKGAGFHRAAGGVVFRVEEEHQGRAIALIDPALDAVLIQHSHGWDTIAKGEGHDRLRKPTP